MDVFKGKGCTHAENLHLQLTTKNRGADFIGEFCSTRRFDAVRWNNYCRIIQTRGYGEKVKRQDVFCAAPLLPSFFFSRGVLEPVG